VHKYRKGKMQRTLKRESKELEVAEREAIANTTLGASSLKLPPVFRFEAYKGGLVGPFKGLISTGVLLCSPSLGGMAPFAASLLKPYFRGTGGWAVPIGIGWEGL